jgi:hypothetical protein
MNVAFEIRVDELALLIPSSRLPGHLGGWLQAKDEVRTYPGMGVMAV